MFGSPLALNVSVTCPLVEGKVTGAAPVRFIAAGATPFEGRAVSFPSQGDSLFVRVTGTNLK